MTEKQYRGRIAPSPTGLLHIGHAVTFWRAYEDACAAGGKLVLRIEDLDRDRCRREFAGAIIGELHWFGLEWGEGWRPGHRRTVCVAYSKPEAVPLVGAMAKLAPLRLD